MSNRGTAGVFSLPCSAFSVRSYAADTQFLLSHQTDQADLAKVQLSSDLYISSCSNEHELNISSKNQLFLRSKPNIVPLMMMS